MRKILTLGLLILITLNTVLAAHYIVGYVKDSYDSEPANGKTIILWNPSNGIGDNLTDIIGPTGMSGADNIYMIDCELLNTPCGIGDTINVKILRDINNYTSETLQLTTTGSGFDVVDNITVNSIPEAFPLTPVNNSNDSAEVIFNCSFLDPDNNVNKVSLIGNWTGSWTINETKAVSFGENYKTFNKDITEGVYLWSCYAEDNLTTGRFAADNYTINIDKTPPTISSIELNKTRLCGTDLIRVNCTTYDTFTGIDKVIIQSINETGSITNYTTQLLSGSTYYKDIATSQTGNWTFNCIVNDSSGNTANLTSETIKSYTVDPDLVIEEGQIYFNATPTTESEAINITTTVKNIGCGTASSIQIGFYNGLRELGNSIQNQTTNILSQEERNISIIWQTEIGLSNISVYADNTDIYSEANESNNNQSASIYLKSWQEAYGNTTVTKILRNSNLNNISLWSEESDLQGNVFVTDKEANINWYNLEAIGKTKTGSTSSNDFSEIDSALSMTQNNDSVYQTFTNTGTPKDTDTFNLFKYQITEVPIVNSTDNTNFTTGILWDKEDSSDNEYDSTEKEDIVFVTKVNKQSIGKFGIYDYEITFPAKLREYDSTNPEEVIFYYELS